MRLLLAATAQLSKKEVSNSILLYSGRLAKFRRLSEALRTSRLLHATQQEVVIVSGEARGVDSLAEGYAQSRRFRSVVIKADWDKWGKSAGFKRNRQIFEFIKGKPEHGCVCFWDGLSRGTADDIKLSAEY